MTGTYRIADRIISIESIHEYVHRLCRDYAVQETSADLGVRISQEDIDNERRRSGGADGEDRAPFSDAYLETLAVYRKIAEDMPLHDTVLFHGSCVAVDGEGYLFAAASGTGKSTHAALWRKILGDRAVMINDDKPFIRIDSGGAVIYGTPWDGKHRLSTNTSVPLKAICLLERAQQNHIERADPREAYPGLLRQVYRPADGEALARTVSLVDMLMREVDLWRLGCNMEDDAAWTSYNAMRG